MTPAREYLARAREAEALAARCVDGSEEQRGFRMIADGWKLLAQTARGRLPPKDA